jgi:hypothetical protein
MRAGLETMDRENADHRLAAGFFRAPLAQRGGFSRENPVCSRKSRSRRIGRRLAGLAVCHFAGSVAGDGGGFAAGVGPLGEASLPFGFDGRCRAEWALGVLRRSKLLGSARRSGPKLQARSAVSGRWGRLRRGSGTPRRGVPTISFSMGAAAPFARWVPPRRSKLVGSARRSGPKLQARSAVSGTGFVCFRKSFLQRRACKTGAASPREWDGSAIHPYHLFSMGAAAPSVRGSGINSCLLVGALARIHGNLKFEFGDGLENPRGGEAGRQGFLNSLQSLTRGLDAFA